jgi:hypothetical protein
MYDLTKAADFCAYVISGVILVGVLMGEVSPWWGVAMAVAWLVSMIPGMNVMLSWDEIHGFRIRRED